jgi:uncharacterized membrane protein HdeD (DUF308 family)
MRTLRFLSGLLLIINGVLHIVEYLKIPNKPESIGVLIFGLIYIGVGLLLFNRKIYPIYLAIVIPLIGMTLSIIKFGIPELISLSALFKLIGLIVIVCCVYLLIKPNKLYTSSE